MSDAAETKAPAPPRKRRAPLGWRVLKWTGIVLLAVIALFALVLFLPFTRQYAFDYGRSILTEAGVQSASFTGSWDRMVLSQVALTDDEGVWATADEVTISWSPFALLTGTVNADRAEFVNAHVYRQPVYKPAPDQTDEPFAWPDLPVDITLASLIGDVTLDQAVIGEAMTVKLTGKADLTGAGGAAELNLNRSDGVPGEAAVTARATADLKKIEVSLNAKDQRVAALLAADDRLRDAAIALQLARDGETCSGQAAISARDGAIATIGVNPNCTFAVELVDVAKLLGPEAGLSGPAGLSVQLVEDGVDETTDFQLSADLSRLLTTDPSLAPLLPGASANAAVTLTANTVQVRELQAQLAGGKLTATGTAEIADNATRAALDLAASDLSVLRPDLKGQMTAKLAYDTAALQPIAIDAAGSDIVSGPLSYRTVALKGAIDATGTGQFTLKGDGEAPIDVTADIANAFGENLTAKIVGEIAAAAIEASAAQRGAATAITADIRTARLDLLGALAGADLEGGLTAKVSAEIGGPTPTIDLDATLKNGRTGATALGDADVKAKGPLNALDVTLSGRVPAGGRVIDYRVAATVADFASARIGAFRAATAKESIEAAGPFTVTFANGVTVDGLVARVARDGKLAGTITAKASAGEAGAKTNVTLAGVDLEALTAVLGRDTVKGLLEGEAELDGGAGRASVNLRISGLTAGGPAGRAPPANLAIAGTWSGGTVRATATATATGLPEARAEVSFPMARAADGGFPSPAPNARLSGKVNWNGRIAPLWRLADIDGHSLDGDAAIDVTIGGTLSAPQVTGGATIANGAYANDALGTRLAALNVAIQMTGTNVTIKGGATDGAQGRLDIDAALGLSGGLGAASGGVTLTQMQLVTRDDLVAAVGGSLKLVPGATGPVLQGALTVTGLEAEIPDPGLSNLVTVEVIDPANPPAPKPVTTAAAAPPEVLSLDIDVSIPGPAKVEGRGLNSLWEGALKITGDASDPRILGKLTLLRGTWDFGSRSFKITEGEIEFDGGPTIEPRIKIVATQEDEDGFTASLTLSGRASEPKISASSVPAAPQDEVFARLLFGRSVSSLSAIEGLELANSIAALSGGQDVRGSLLGGLRDRFGLDVLAVDVSDTGDTSVRAGAYLMENVYFELRQGGASGGTTGRLEIQIDENLSVETEVGADSSSSVGARYRLDY
ncbi:MAG: translocation/assembly module TamB domain-containing protein [Micropepsaceae bacterium]